MSTTRKAEWSFVSGKVVSLEAELLPRAFFDSVVKSRSRADARSALGKSAYRSLFVDDKSLDSASSILAAHGKEVKSEIFKLCPQHPLENFCRINDRFRTFRTLFSQMSKAGSQGRGDLDSLFGEFAVEPKYADKLEEHRNALVRKNTGNVGAVERSLCLDSAACTIMRTVAQSVPERLVREYMIDKSLLAAWSSIYRSRANGASADVVKAWFLYDGSTEFASAMMASENDPRQLICARLTPRSSAILENIDPHRIKADIDSVAADVLRDTVLACRLCPVGPEKVLAYIVAVETELVNLELALSAVANDLDRDTALSRLRREYA